ncbi:MAG: hydroxymethylglutaryl-CoA lyase [Mycobacteriales bacterium]
MSALLSNLPSLPNAVSLREVGPRDGLQNEAAISTSDKISLINALSATGVSRIEAVSFVHPKAVPQMADAEEVWFGVTRTSGVRYSALVPNLRGAQRAIVAGFTEIELVLSASDTHNRRNVGRSTQQSLRQAGDVISLLHSHGAIAEIIIATAFGCPYVGDVPPERVVRLVNQVVAQGADRVAFGDTTGMATPRGVVELVDAVRNHHPDLPILLHFHNTRGTALANVLAALQLGVTEFDASVGGLGGCPYAPGASGNLATEELVHMLDDMGIATGIDLQKLLEVAVLAQRLVGRQLPSAILRAGPRSTLASEG